MKSILSSALLLAPLAAVHAAHAPQSAKPNIVFIMADDAGIGDFTPYGCKYGVTPNIDRLAREGMKFTQAYSGNAVCSPSRCVLMTGLHPGHAAIRANAGSSASTDRRFQALPAGQATVAKLLHEAGYATGGFGKWGLGNPGEISVPEKEGFDVFFGYYDQTHAHNYYTDHLVRNSVNVPIQQSGKHTWEDYSHTRIANETLKFIEDNKDHPFFCYAAWTPPHGRYEIPSNAPYSDKPWKEPVKNYAAMVALLDQDVGRVLQKLQELGLDDQTLVVFSSDNGANVEFIQTLGSTGGLRGHKRLLYEGGTRAPLIARWPGKIQPGSTSDLLTSFIDFMPTAADIGGVAAPKGIDGFSILPTLLGRKQPASHEFLYFEIYEPYFQQSVRWGDWKGYRLGTQEKLELYDLKTDPAEKHDVAAANPDRVKKLESIMAAEHTASPQYTTPERHKALKKGKMNGTKKKQLSLEKMLNDREDKT